MGIFGLEKDFENAIEKFFISPEGGYLQGNSKYNQKYALYEDSFISFIKNTQQENWDKFCSKAKTDKQIEEFLSEFSRIVDEKGILYVLRNGFKIYGVQFKAAYFKPESHLNPETDELYTKNVCECYRQWYYNGIESVDMVLVLNGIPVFAFELKNQFTGQSVKDSKKQWVNRLAENEQVFSFNKRVLAFFAVDLLDVFMSTEPKDLDSFLPFNQGSNGAGNEGGKGNPQPEPGEYATAYLWKLIFQKDSMLELINRFISLEVKVENDRNGKEHELKRLIFPRYHQIDAIRKIIADIQEKGTGKNYLVQHSAGSGKSNTIGWLAYRLAKMFDAKGTEPLYTSVLVITDRKVLDKNLRDTIGGFEHEKGFIEEIAENKKIAGYRDKGKDIAGVIKAGARIIIVTLQTFAANYDKIINLVDTKDMKFAVIVDEAHESQNGDNAEKLKKGLADTTLTAEQQEELETKIEDDEEANSKLVKELATHGQHKNLSFFAFTATPKDVTLRVFGVKGNDGKFHPYHIYSMKQAIEEGFILDVLKYYRTYKSHLKLVKTIPLNPNVDELRAARQIHSFIFDNPITIAEKAPIILDIFVNITREGIVNIETGERKGKMMVVSPSRLAAVRYYKELTRLIREKPEYEDIRVLVAFSGEVTDPDTKEKYTEAGTNKREDGSPISENQTQYEFHNNFDILVVADKYQTGFSESYLHTMIVDKKLKKIKAVQTLSRLNRTCKNKNSTFILDFANTDQEIKDAFQPFYKETTLDDQLDIKNLYEKKQQLRSYGIYSDNDVNEVGDVFYKCGGDKEKLLAYISGYLIPMIDRFVKLLEKDEDHALTFRTDLSRFINYYAKIIQVIRHWDFSLHYEYIYCMALLKILPFGTVQYLDIKKYLALPEFWVDQVKEVFNGAIVLDDENGEQKSGGISQGPVTPANLSPLDEIIHKVNEKFGSKVTEKEEKVITYLYEKLTTNEELIELAKNILFDSFEQSYFSKFYTQAAIEGYQQNKEMFEDFLHNIQMYEWTKKHLCTRIYKKFHEAA